MRIFRKHGFAWGGNLRTPDGMHFEWVGEARDQIGYPSRYCPNNVGGGTAIERPERCDWAATIGRDVLIAGVDDGSAA